MAQTFWNKFNRAFRAARRQMLIQERKEKGSNRGKVSETIQGIRSSLLGDSSDRCSNDDGGCHD